MTYEEYKAIAKSVPKQPGVYRFFNAEGKVIYVGKAKNLRHRLASYFGEKKKFFVFQQERHHICLFPIMGDHCYPYHKSKLSILQHKFDKN